MMEKQPSIIQCNHPHKWWCKGNNLMLAKYTLMLTVCVPTYVSVSMPILYGRSTPKRRERVKYPKLRRGGEKEESKKKKGEEARVLSRKILSSFDILAF